ncbi:MFS transporter [Tabrizicola sp.]|uniref:MFS transporter n=1 Tax=Tabrizicola sp. TaxID=2005166 RepID=UPI003F2FA805
MSTNPWVVFGVASAAVFLVSVDATIAVAAFPALRSSFADSTPATLSWVLNGYTILYAALLVPAGRLVDLHGAKRLFLFGVALFTLASGACGMAPGTNSLIAARIVQAVGGAVLTPASLALILGAFPADKRSAVVGLWSAAGALGAAVGPGAGAILIELATWRAAFLVNLPFGALILLYAARRLPNLQGADAGEGLDIPGIALIATGVAALAYGVVQIEEAGFASATVWGSALAGAGLLISYAFWARGRGGAAIDMTLFADRTYALVTVASFVFGIAFSMMFLSSFLFLLGIWGYSQGLTGLAVTPGPLVVIAVAIASGRLVALVGHRAVLVAGGGLYAAAQFWLAVHMTETAAYVTLWFPMQIVGGTAVGLLLVGLSGAAVAGLPPARFGVGGAVNNAVRQLGGVFGTALAVVLVGQTGAGIEAFQSAFVCLGLIGLATAILCLPLPGKSGRVLRVLAE